MDAFYVMKTIFTVTNLLFMLLGMAAGTIIGALPGLTATMGVAILLPLTFGMDSVTGMLTLLAVYCGGIYGGSITAVLIKAPGTPASAATVLDGYPMASRGEGGNALYAALVSSVIGGIFSCIMLIFFAPKLAQAALKFGSPEYFSLALFGLTVISIATSKNAFKGLMMASTGLLITMIGIDPIEGVTRFTFGVTSLSSGIALVPAMLGAFALTELFAKMRDSDQVSGAATRYNKADLKIKDVLKYWKTILKSSCIGTFIGAVPGTGAAISSFLAYNEAKRASKEPETFGKGNIEGVIASETANNAVTGATLIPLLTLGIPGDSVTAILIGALMMQGIVPGPTLFTENVYWVYAIMGGLLIVNILMFFEGKFFCRFFVNVTKIPVNVLIALIMVLCVLGSFAVNNTVFDVKVTLVFGILCYVLSRLDFPMTPLVISMVLGSLAERNLRQSLVMSGGSFSIFFTRPISVAFLLVTFILLAVSVWKTLEESSKKSVEEILTEAAERSMEAADKNAGNTISDNERKEKK